MDLPIILAAKYLYLVVILSAGIFLFKTPKETVFKIIKLAIFSLPLSLIIAKIASHFVYNPRPFVVEKITPLIPHAANNGFPSDHTLLAMAISSLFLIHNRNQGIFLTILTFAVGISRVAAKIHHPTDIIASITIALFATILSHFLIENIKFIKLWTPSKK